jgi:hypothetical protein
MPELQDLIRLFLRDWDVRFGPKADILRRAFGD